LTIESDGERKPRNRHEFAIEGDDRPYSLSVAEVSLRATNSSGKIENGEGLPWGRVSNDTHLAHP
jgi:hypothetical protein